MIKSTLGSPTPIRPKSMTRQRVLALSEMLNRLVTVEPIGLRPAYERVGLIPAAVPRGRRYPVEGPPALRVPRHLAPQRRTPRRAAAGSVARKAVSQPGLDGPVGSTNASPAAQRRPAGASSRLPNPTELGWQRLDAQRSAAATVARSALGKPSLCAGYARPGLT